MAAIKRFFSNELVIIFLIIVVAYLPFLSFQLSLKNDTRVVSYPIFYFFSEQLKHGFLPLWHYNMHLGYPLYADPGTPFFNPLFWLFALIGSSFYVYSFFVFAHIFIGAAGTLFLMRSLGFQKTTNIIIAVTYVCSGFYVSHLQHANNILEVAYLPFIVHYFIKLIVKPTFNIALLLAFFVYLITVSGYPAFPIALLYFLSILLATFLISGYPDKQIKNWKIRIVYLLLTIAICTLLCSPYLFAIITNISNFQRSITFENTSFVNTGGITLTSLASFIWPLTSITTTQFSASDITWNNMYFGVLLLAFVCYSFRFMFNKLVIGFAVVGLFSLLLSFQGYPKILFFKLPLISFLRNNGELRIFAIFSLLVIASFGLNAFFIGSKNFKLVAYKNILKLLIICIIAIVCFVTIAYSPIANFKNISNWRDTLLSISFSQAIILHSIILLFTLIVGYYFIEQKKVFAFIVIADVIICFVLMLPITGLSLRSGKEVNSDIAYSINTVNSFNDNKIETKNLLSPAVNLSVVHPAFFSTKIGLIDSTAYPSGAKRFFNFAVENGYSFFDNKSAIFYESLSKFSTVNSYQINGSSITITCDNKENDTLVVMQNFDNNWEAYVDGKKYPISMYKNTFMQIHLPFGKHSITLKYNPIKELFWMKLFLVAQLMLYFYWTVQFYKRHYLVR